MKRTLAAATSVVLSAALVLLTLVWSPVTATAAPLPAPYGADGDASVVNVGLDLLTGIDLADVALANTQATTDSTGAPQADSISRNLAAQVAGLPINVVSNRQFAPPDQGGPANGSLLAVNALGISLGAMTTVNEAHYVDDNTCIPGQLSADAFTQTAGVNVTPLGLAEILDLGVSSVRNTNELVTTSGLNRAVRSSAVGSITGLSLLNENIEVAVNGTATLAATANGQAGGATITHQAPTVVVTGPGIGTVTLTPAIPSVTVSVALVGSATISLNPDPTVVTQAADGTAAAATWSFLSIDIELVNVGPLPPLATASIDITPLRAEATSPVGGTDCAPPAPTVTLPADGSTINDSTPDYTGTGLPGATVDVVVDGASIGTATVDGDGNWTLAQPTALADGDHTVNATQTVAGAISPVSATNTFTLDATAPDAPVITAPENGALLADSTPDIVGTAEAGASVEVFVDGTSVGSTAADGDGNWTLTPTTPLADGPHTATAVATDGAGNPSAPSNEVAFTIDTTAPAAPVITTPVDGSSTNDTTPTISGTAEANTTVTVTVDGAELGTAPVDGDGNWTLTPTAPLAEGEHTATAVATDAAGNVSDPSNEVSFTVDLTAPAAPVITAPADGSSTNDTTPTISGTAEANSTVTVTLDGAEIGTATADGDGNWTLTPTDPLAEGEHTATAVSTDPAGNESPVSNEVTFTVDLTAPAAPVITAPEDGDLLPDATPDISGTAEPGASVEVFVDGTSIGTTTADGAGVWTVTPTDPLAEGPHTASAVATDAAGNESVPSNEVTFTIDTTAPEAPVITTPVDGSSTNDTTPTISGTAEANSFVTVALDGTAIGTVTADGDGNWTLTPTDPLAVGEHTASAVATDAAGNLSDPSNDVTFTIDTTAPEAPVITVPVDGSSTNDATPAISGTAEANSTVTVTLDGAELGTVEADEDGNWSLTPTDPLAEGEHTASAVATDAAGNVSDPSNEVTFTVDTTAPEAPVITAPVDGSSTGNTTPAIDGTAEPNSTVTVTLDGAELGTATADGDGNWSLTPTDPLAEGPHTATAVSTDAAGNESPVSNEVTFTVDTAAPAAPVITAPAEDAVLQGPDVTVSGTGEPGAAVTVTDQDDNPYGPVTVDLDGNWSVELPGLADGDYTVTATQTDLAGNVSPESAPRNFTVDSSAPDAPVITAPADGSVISDPSPTIGGTGEVGSSVLVTDQDGTTYGPVTVDGDGNWEIPGVGPLTDGSYTITAVQTDAGGNPSAASDPVTFTVDTVAPDAPEITAPADGSSTNDTTPDISGTAEANSTVTVTLDGTEIGTADVDAAGNWVLSPTAPLAEGPHTATAVSTDAAGNESPVSNEVTFTIDTTAPAAPVIEAPVNGSTTNDNTPPITGTAEPGATVTVTLDGAEIGSTTADPDGNWTVTPAAPLTDGDHTATAVATDAAGNDSPVSNTVTFAVDTVAPAAPEITAPSDGDLTTDATPEITGTAEAGSTVEVFIDGESIGTTTADSGGNWTLTPSDPLADGEHTITATATDGSGNVSAPSEPVTITVDTTAPAAPQITEPVDGSSTNDSTPDIAGTAEPGSTVEVFVDGEPIGTTTADPDGNWTLTPSDPLTDGEHTITATATDAADHTSAPSDPVTVTVDTAAPAAPVITAPADGSTTTDATPEVVGTAEPGSTVVVSVDGTEIGSTTADPDGNWTLTPTVPLADGVHTVTATATDEAGNVSEPSDPVTVTVDTTAPAPVITYPSDGDVLTDTTPTVTGTAEPGSTVEVFVDGEPAGTTTADADGNWSLDVPGPLGEGEHSVTATATDPVGNVSAPADPVSFAIDTGAPAAPAITAPENGSTITDNSPTITGTGEPGSTVTVTDQDGAIYGPATVGDDGTWTIEVDEPLSDGAYTISAVQTDGNGRESATSAPVTFTVDTQAPAAPVIINPAPDSTINDRTPQVNGTAEPGSSVTVRIDGTVVGTVTTAPDGRWYLPLTTQLPFGDHEITATATDAAGHTSPPTTVRFTIVPGTGGGDAGPGTGGGIAYTGAPVTGLALSGLLLLLAGALLVRRGRRLTV